MVGPFLHSKQFDPTFIETRVEPKVIHLCWAVGVLLIYSNDLNENSCGPAADGSQLFALSAVSRVQELQFPAVDPNWYQKLEAIESLDDRYKALWNVLLEYVFTPILAIRKLSKLCI